MTFGDMVSDPEFEALAAKCKEQNSMDDEVFDAAMRLLRSKRLRKREIKMVMEMQLYLGYFLERRRICHIWYKIVRAADGPNLTRDCAKYATAAGMAFVPPPQGVQRLIKDRGAMRQLREWGFENASVNLRRKGLTDADGVLIARALKHMKYLDFNVTELE